MTSDPYFAAPIYAPPTAAPPTPVSAQLNDFRPPGPGECAVCGCTPATPTRFRRQSGFLVMSQQWTENVSYCKDCATAAFRRCQDWCMTRGWWGFISSIINIFAVLGNADQMRRLSTMPRATNRDPQVWSHLQQPADPGRPLSRRPGAYITGALVTLVALAFMLQ
jgi:hypothetical protein